MQQVDLIDQALSRYLRGRGLAAADARSLGRLTPLDEAEQPGLVCWF